VEDRCAITKAGGGVRDATGRRQRWSGRQVSNGATTVSEVGKWSTRRVGGSDKW
jgi:hypothetical protein